MSLDVMKQALEVLNTGGNEVLPEDYGQMVSEAITALRAAIEQSEKPWVKSYAGGKPNYTVPEEQTCQWQGLTDEDVNTIWRDIDGSEGLLMRFARAIEAKLKEKNT